MEMTNRREKNQIQIKLLISIKFNFLMNMGPINISSLFVRMRLCIHHNCFSFAVSGFLTDGNNFIAKHVKKIIFNVGTFFFFFEIILKEW